MWQAILSRKKTTAIFFVASIRRPLETADFELSYQLHLTTFSNSFTYYAIIFKKKFKTS